MKLEITQSKIVELATEKGFKGLNHLWFDNNTLDDQQWFLECCKIQKWLREEHGIDVLVVPAIKERPYKPLILNDNEMAALGCFTQYEQALERGLYESLKLI